MAENNIIRGPMGGEAISCTKCGIEKPWTLSFFSEWKPGKLRRDCRMCRLAYAKQYREANPERVADAKRASVAKNPEPYRAAAKRHAAKNEVENKARLAKLYSENRETIKERSREWRLLNPEKAADTMRKYKSQNAAKYREYLENWKQKNPERFKDISRGIQARRMARKLASRGSFNAYHVQAILSAQKMTCWYCSCKLTDYHIDHRIPLAKGGSNGPENLVAACPTCNLKKGSKMPWEIDNPRLL